ncbi:MAG: hypothetical protein M9921_15310 [Fimbriimonadaceae bacterium]|nr:hypothetical protein [Fimbriimonadaceae bacterium]
MKSFVLVAVFLAASLVGAQDVAQKVTFSHVAAPTRVLLPLLSAQTGVPLVVAGAAADEIVVIRVKDAVLNDVLKRIAEVTSCDWKAEGDGFRLVTANAARSIEERTEREQRIANLRKQIAERVKALQKKDKGDAEEEQGFSMPFFSSGDSAAKAITQLLAGIDVSRLATLQRGERVVYSTAPTRMQLPLGRNTSAILGEYVAAHNAEASQIRESMGQEAMTDEQRKAMEFAEKMMGSRQKPVTDAPVKALLVGSRQSLFDTLTVELRLFNAQGKVILSGSDSLMTNTAMFEQMAMAIPGAQGSEEKEKEKPDPDPRPIEFSKTTKELAGLFGQLGMGGGTFSMKMSPELRALLLRPDEHDPLSFVPSETLLAIAEMKDLQLVAALPDSLGEFTRLFVANSKPTVGRALEEFLKGDETQGGIADGWLVLRPARPAENRTIRVPRAALAKLIGVSETKGVPSLDDLASYALAAEPPMETPGAMLHLMLFAPNSVGSGMAGPQDWDMLRFYSTLTPGQRDLLARGEAIPLPNLSIQQRNFVAAMAFGSDAKLRIGPKKPDSGDFMEMVAAFMPGQTQDFREEPTEVMPTGLPAAGRVTMQLTNAPIVVLANSPETPGGGVMESALLRGALGVDELALFEMFRQDPNFGAVASMMPQLDKVRVGQRKKLDFSFALGPSVFMDRLLQDDAHDPKATPIAIENLPADFKTLIAKRVEQFKKGMLPFLGIGEVGRQVPPPPPVP